MPPISGLGRESQSDGLDTKAHCEQHTTCLVISKVLATTIGAQNTQTAVLVFAEVSPKGPVPKSPWSLVVGV